MSLDDYPRISTLLFDQPWAITPRALDSIIHRVETASIADLEAISTKIGRPLENTSGRVEVRDGIAVMNITGPIFRHANLFHAISGAATAEFLMRDFQAALENPVVSKIVLDIDSPGGEVAGIADLADAIHEGNKRKPVTAFVDYLGASAAYWIASAAGKIYGSASSFTGSIGVVASFLDRRGAQERQGVKLYEIISSQSPKKHADPGTDEGRSQMQEMVDSLAALFIERVALYRGVTGEKVISDFGKGGVMIARLAQPAGMIDGITTFEALMASLSTNTTTVAGIAAKEEHMNEPTTATAPDAQAIIAAERQRMRDIQALPEAKGREALAQAIATETNLDVAQAKTLLAASTLTPPPAAANPLEQRMTSITNPDVGVGGDSEASEVAKEVASILAFAPKSQRIQRAS